MLTYEEGGVVKFAAAQGLTKMTQYVLYLVAAVPAGLSSVQAVPWQLLGTTIDSSPPTFEDGYPAITAISAASFKLTVAMDEPATAFFVVATADAMNAAPQLSAGTVRSAAIASTMGTPLLGSSLPAVFVAGAIDAPSIGVKLAASEWLHCMQHAVADRANSTALFHALPPLPPSRRLGTQCAVRGCRCGRGPPDP